MSKFFAFFSYARIDAKADAKLYAAFSAVFEEQVNLLLSSDEVAVWKDDEDIELGDRWEQRLKEQLAGSHMLIVMLSPKWLASKWCREEYASFQQIEKKLPSQELVFPLLVRELEDEKQFFDEIQRKAYDSLMERQYKPALADDFLLLSEDQRAALVTEIAKRIKPKLDLLRRAEREKKAKLEAERVEQEKREAAAATPARRAAPPKAPPLPPHNLPLQSLGGLFMGRDAFMERLSATLEGGAAAVTQNVLHGMGGIGKTRLAIEYAWRNAEKFSALLFVSAETPELLDTGLAGLATTLNLPEKDLPQDPPKRDAVLAWLAQNPGWLLILDNVDEARAAEAVIALLPRLASGKTLITARWKGFPGELPMMELEVLPAEDAQKFLLARTRGRRREGADDAAKAAELAKNLGYLALALEQAGAFIAAEHISFDRYLAYWRDERARVTGWFDKTRMATNHDVGLAAVWKTSVARLSEQGRRLLERVAFLAPEPIPEFLLDVAVSSLRAEGEAIQEPRDQTGSLRSARDDAPFDARAALRELYSYALAAPAEVEGRYRQPAFSVHRLIQDFVRDSMSAERRDDMLREALAWVNAAFVGDPGDVRNWPKFDPLAPHATAVAETADKAGIAEPTNRVMNEVAELFGGQARNREAEPLYRRALDIDEKALGPDHPNVAIDLSNLAQLLHDTNRLAEAEPLMRRTLDIGEKAFGPDHPDVAIRLNNLAQLLHDTNRLEEAEPLMRRALDIDEKTLGPDHPKVAIRLNNLAGLLQDTGRLAEAELLMRRALDIGEKTLGPDHPKVAIRLNNLAQLLQAANRLDEAEPLMRRALEIGEKALGPDHAWLAYPLNNLAGLLKSTNRSTEAEPLMRRAVKICAATLGPEHPHTQRVANNYRILLIELGAGAEEAEAKVAAALRGE